MLAAPSGHPFLLSGQEDVLVVKVVPCCKCIGLVGSVFASSVGRVKTLGGLNGYYYLILFNYLTF